MIPKQNGSNSESKRLLGFPCGCESRKDIMGAGEWQRDAIVLGVVVLIPLIVYAYVKWGKVQE